MASETFCLRCGSAQLIPAHLEQQLAFCVDHDAHHGVRHLGLKVLICQDCGHIEFLVRNPADALAQPHRDPSPVIQEEDF